MKIITLIVFLLFAYTMQASSSANELHNIDSDLMIKMMENQGDSKNTIPIIVLLKSESFTTKKMESKQKTIEHMKNDAHISQNDFLMSDEFKRSKHEIKNINQFWIINAIAMDVTPQTIEAISKNKNVQLITSVKPIYLLESTISQSNSDTIYAQALSVTWGVSKIRAPDVWNLSITGSGVNISIIDSGINASHSDLDDLDDNVSTYDPKVIKWIDYVNAVGTSYDDNGHGTHVAGTASGTGGIGVAPDTNLFAAKVFDSSGVGSGLDLYYAFQWSIENGADIISFSGGGDHDPIFTYMIDNTIAAGVVPVIAAGNSGNASTITCPGDEKKSLTVGATDSSDTVASFSSRGPVTLNGETYIKPDVSAPGVGIDSSYNDGGYYTMSGTSMATPHVSGAAALMLQVNPSLSPTDVKSILESTSVDINPVGKDNNTGSGRIDAYNATIAVDTNPPSFSNETPTNASFTNNQTPLISINITDTGIRVNISTIVMKVNGSDVDETITPIPNGFHVENLIAQPFADGQLVNVSVTASDNASNSLTYNWSFTIDTTPPVVNITYPTEYLVIKISTPNLNITTNETSDIWYRVGNGTNINGTQGMAFNTTLSQLSDSRYNITAFARDLAGNLNSTMVNFTIFTTPPVISAPAADEIFYITQNTTYVNGTTSTIVTNVSVYVNSVLVNESYPVTNGMFNISGVPLVSGTNTINVTAIYNDSVTEYFSTNTSLTVSVGEIFDIEGADNITIDVPGLAQGIALPFIDFNITGQGNNIPTNISSSVVAAASAPPASNITGPAIDFSVPGPGNESYIFNCSISLTLGFNASSVVDFNKTVVAWYNESTGTWVSLKSTVNTTTNTTTANVTHFTIFAPIEDNTPPANITSLTSTGQTTSSITLSWTNSSDTEYIEIWRSNSHLTNVSTTSYTDGGLSSNTPYTYALRPFDIVGNKGNWSNVTVSTASPETPSSGGGGGGGGGSTGEEYENIEFKDVSRVYISRGADISFTFDETGNDIQYVNYKALTSAGYISATIEVLKDTSALVEHAPSGTVYKNMNIWVGKYGYATEHNIENPVIGFKVRRSWIQDNRIDANSIKLNCYSEDVWTALPTTKTDEDATYIYFESQTPSFSPFAITAQGKALISKASVKSETVAAEPLLPDEPVEEQPAETEYVEETSMWGNLLISALILTVIAGAYLYMRKQQS